MKQEPLLELCHISYAYGKTPALRDISACFYAGERVAVLGNNGAGKSTFFLCCNGVLHPSGGEVRLHGESLSRKKKDLIRLRESIGLVFQDPDDQIIASTVEAEVSFGPMNLGLPREEVAARTGRSLEAMGLSDYRSRPPHSLSGGERKRVSVAGILAMHPELILFDEPTSSLDYVNLLRLRETLDDLSETGVALVVATHDIDFAWSWADRILLFLDGTVAADRTPEALFGDAALLERAQLRRPVLYAAAESVCHAAGRPLPDALPKTEEAFDLFTKELFG